ncbi:CDP-diacylglycerol--serine O-phosphatidyltransferase [Veillonella agrestimuris]|uniref:CDP-diacylglycerol--serine O-phosphatidyltransferase n=1 Tax=Veillonella agrestimuris TaxID=2941340 RepID=UPI0020409DBF|nr:CDP-diacylglycerol--serine O-phosphatidyltransferase [Veillonella agrestimuris]
MNKSILPNLFTTANLAFGVIGITLSAMGNTWAAAICVLLSLVADALDGRVARALGVAGPMGRELDSLSDVVGFGVAPAYMIYMSDLQGLGWLGYIPLILFAVLGAFRLARFNIKTEEVHGYFEGLPIPAAGCLLATYVLSAVQAPQLVVFLAMIVIAVLMVSQAKYPDFKGKGAIYVNYLAIALAVLGALAIVIYDYHTWALAIFIAYVLFGAINSAMNIFRK